ncbi:hypothetical protein EDD18DRAFT_1104546 [Armillaria luteobubalina]|uniref:Uncharacterized protein n=1 Tax=Armillaria luteobubalina TaxID=153913 RepID=A0AA39Q876_9AGAR|nr:hypothetical protein EDD18DRAFT_1104546 [Armillaria luteobubalina]
MAMYDKLSLCDSILLQYNKNSTKNSEAEGKNRGLDHWAMHSSSGAGNSFISGLSTLDTENIIFPSARAPTDAMGISQTLIKPPRDGFQVVRDENSRKWIQELGSRGIRPESVFYYQFDPPAALHLCSIDKCGEEFQWNEIHKHIIIKHRGISGCDLQ